MSSLKSRSCDHAEGCNYGCKGLDGNTSLGLCEFCKIVKMWSMCTSPNYNLMRFRGGNVVCAMLIPWANRNQKCSTTLLSTLFSYSFLSLAPCITRATRVRQSVTWIWILLLGLKLGSITVTAQDLLRSKFVPVANISNYKNGKLNWFQPQLAFSVLEILPIVCMLCVGLIETWSSWGSCV